MNRGCRREPRNLRLREDRPYYRLREGTGEKRSLGRGFAGSIDDDKKTQGRWGGWGGGSAATPRQPGRETFFFKGERAFL